MNSSDAKNDANKGTVWITRSEPGAVKSRTIWERAGFDCYMKPVIAVSIAPHMPKPLPDRAVLLITSQNALRILGILTDRRDWPVMTVGDASAAMARKMGFEDVLSAKGNGQDLLEMVQKVYEPGSQKVFVYASGANIRLNLATALREKGYKARRDVYYRNEVVQNIDLSDAPELSHIALYSPMAARRVRPFAGRFKKAQTISISAQADQELQERFKGRRIVSKRPMEAAMIFAVSS